MGAADVVQPPGLPRPAGVPATSSASSLATPPLSAQAAPGGDLIGRRPTINGGMADVVQPPRLQGSPAAAAAEALPGAASMLGRVARVAGPAVGLGLEGKQVYDVARDPNSTGIDVASQVAQGAGRLGAAGAGAAGGAALGSLAGPPGALVGGMIGGAAGYWGADKAIDAGRSAVGVNPAAPAPLAAQAAAPTGSGGAVFGVYPKPSSQLSTNANDAALRRGVQATGPSTFVPATPIDQLSAPPLAASAAGGGRGSINPPLSSQAAQAPAAAPDPQPQQTQAPNYQGAGSVTDLGGISASPGDRLAQLNRDIAFQQDKQTWRNPNDPTPGLALIDGAGQAGDARQKFFDEANLRNVAARGAPPGRNGAAVFEQNLNAAQQPLVSRARQQLADTASAGETQRAQIAERGSLARTAVADARNQDANAIARARLGIEAVKAGQGNLPTGYRQKADGSGLEYIPGGPADPETAKGKNSLNDTQAKALQFGTRMQVSGKLLDDLAGQGVTQPGLIKRAGDAVGVGGLLNGTQSSQQQQVEQAQRDFVNAALRRESGAAIAESEFANAKKQYFPQIGDGPEVIAQKKANRELATRGILAEVPNGDSRVASILPPQQAGAAGNAAAPSIPAGMSHQVGTSGGKPVYEDAQGNRFIGG